MIFYTVFSLLLATFLVVISIIKFKDRKIVSGIIYLVLSILYITLGLLSSLLKIKYEWIYVIVLIVLTIISLLLFKLLDKREKL